MRNYFSKKRNGLKLMYLAAILYTLFLIIAIIASDFAGAESFLLVIIWGGIFLLLTKFTDAKPLWGGILSIILSLSFVFNGVLGIIKKYVSLEMFFTDLALLCGGLLFFTGALTVIWSTHETKYAG